MTSKQVRTLRRRLRKEHGVTNFMTANLLAKGLGADGGEGGASFIEFDLLGHPDTTMVIPVGQNCTCCGPKGYEVTFRGVSIQTYLGDVTINNKTLD